LFNLLRSSQVLILLSLAVVGWAGLDRRKETQRSAELLLCGWLVAGLFAYLACARPTFTQYFVLLIPFLAIPASLGACVIAARIGRGRWSAVFLLMVLGLYFIAPARWVARRPTVHRWQHYEEVAREVDRLTPRRGQIFANELVYFASSRTPPAGLEHSLAQRLDLPRGLATTLQIVPQKDVDAWLQSGRFDTVVVESDDPRVPTWDLGRTYARSKRILDYEVWTKGAGESP
jgi:hypothetical protein